MDEGSEYQLQTIQYTRRMNRNSRRLSNFNLSFILEIKELILYIVPVTYLPKHIGDSMAIVSSQIISNQNIST